MTERDFQDRTKRLALDVIRVAEAIPRSVAADTMTRQLVRCATSVAANYRAACRAKSKTDMMFKLGIVEEETDEVMFWLELLCESGITASERLTAIRTEAEAILRMTVASRKTLRASLEK